MLGEGDALSISHIHMTEFCLQNLEQGLGTSQLKRSYGSSYIAAKWLVAVRPLKSVGAQEAHM
jgi:hypothetical protein